MTMRKPRPATKHAIGARTLLLGALLLTLIVYLPGISGGFVFDDYNNILLNEDLKIERFSFTDLLQVGWSGKAGPLKRPLAMMSFAINFATTGEFIGGFKLTNLLIHLFNGWLVFLLARLLLGAHCQSGSRRNLPLSTVAALAAAIWLLHPLNLTSVLYIVQRMTSLSALFSLAAMISYCVGRQRLESNLPRAWLLIIVGTPFFILLGLLSKENAVLTLPLIALIEVCFFRFRASNKRDRRTLIWIFGLGFVLPVAMLVIGGVINGDLLAARFQGRPFTLAERLMTEARVLWFYLACLLIPRLSQLGLFHDDFQLSTSLFEPLSTSFGITGVVVAVIIAVATGRRYPMVTFAIGWFLIAHLLESSVIALELVHEHRNYLPIVGVILALTYGIACALQGHASSRLKFAIAALVLSLCALLTFSRAGDWSDPVTLAVIEAERHPDSFRAVYDLGRIQLGMYQLSHDEQIYESAVRNLLHSASLDPSATQPYMGLMRMEYQRGRVPKTEWKEELLRRYQYTLFHPSEVSTLSQLIKCRLERICDFPRDVVLEFYQAALSNSTVRRYSKAQLMVALAVFYVNEAGDLVPAMNLLDDAVALYPREFNFRKLRARIYIMADRFDEVEEEIRFMRSISLWRDKLKSPVESIDSLERDVAQAKQKVVGDP